MGGTGAPGPYPWRLRVTTSILGTSAPSPVGLVMELDGIQVRCERCGRPGVASLRRRRTGFTGYLFYTRCKACHRKNRIGSFSAAEAVAEAAPDAVHLLAPKGYQRG